MLSPQFMFLIRVLHKNRKEFFWYVVPSIDDICIIHIWNEWNRFDWIMFKKMQKYKFHYILEYRLYRLRDKLMWLEMNFIWFLLSLLCWLCRKIIWLLNFLIYWSFFFIFSGDKPHACELCNKKFALACNLRAHMKTHEGRFCLLFFVFWFTFCLFKMHLGWHLQDVTK